MAAARPDPNAPGVDGPLGHQDDDDLYPLSASLYEVDLVNDAFHPQVLVEGANEGAKPSENSAPLGPMKPQ